ncbi:hypothetical protein GEMRC1_005911 [Eukaryota sp. GEM-RC1]
MDDDLFTDLWDSPMVEQSPVGIPTCSSPKKLPEVKKFFITYPKPQHTPQRKQIPATSTLTAHNTDNSPLLQRSSFQPTKFSRYANPHKRPPPQPLLQPHVPNISPRATPRVISFKKNVALSTATSSIISNPLIHDSVISPVTTLLKNSTDYWIEPALIDELCYLLDSFHITPRPSIRRLLPPPPLPPTPQLPSLVVPAFKCSYELIPLSLQRQYRQTVIPQNLQIFRLISITQLASRSLSLQLLLLIHFSNPSVNLNVIDSPPVKINPYGGEVTAGIKRTKSNDADVIKRARTHNNSASDVYNTRVQVDPSRDTRKRPFSSTTMCINVPLKKPKSIELVFKPEEQSSKSFTEPSFNDPPKPFSCSYVQSTPPPLYKEQSLCGTHCKWKSQRELSFI